MNPQQLIQKYPWANDNIAHDDASHDVEVVSVLTNSFFSNEAE